MPDKGPKVDEKEKLKKVTVDLAKARAPGKPGPTPPAPSKKP